MSRVVHVLGRFPPPADGQTLATERCASFLDEAFEVSRLDTRPPGPGLVVAEPTFDVRRTMHFLRLRSHLRRELARAPRAPVIWHSVSPAALGHARDRLTTLPALAPGQPLAAVFHRALFERLGDSALTARSARTLVERASTVVFQSAALAARCQALVPAHKQTVIPNTVRDDIVVKPGEAASRRLDPERPFHILFLSNMLPEKGYADVLRAVAHLLERGHSIRATFAGRWPTEVERETFEHDVQALGVSEQVVISGTVADPAEVRRLHLAADAFVLPTSHPTETQPIAILEALGAGTPVVTVDRPVTRDMLTDGVEGALVPAHAPEALAEALRGLMVPDRWQAASRAARARFDAQFAPAVVGELWRSLARTLQP